MKKLINLLAVVALVASVQVANAADQSVAGGFEASGSIVSGFGWQKYKNAGAASANLAADYNGFTAGVLGAYLPPGAVVNDKDQEFQFFVDSIELDLAKTFGENIRFRTDLDFGSTNM